MGSEESNQNVTGKVLHMMLVRFPDLIIPTLSFYVFAIGVWNYRFRSRAPPPHFDPKLSLAKTIDTNELDEEFDLKPCDIATQGERAQALVMWRDPRATEIFIAMGLVVAIILYLVPSKIVAMTFGFTICGTRSLGIGRRHRY
ncbi:C2 calcium-dependent membrane targeting [Artemisia annua]|uniref:C2 calcium-dependent membrane targeting n=1 Tax=Artemisia annua TaxID=35608 RepID=A0A2U1QPE7_ARTAN|nr:C2 calcium-dependent membrane targeting [Artemisia annua]